MIRASVIRRIPPFLKSVVNAATRGQGAGSTSGGAASNSAMVASSSGGAVTAPDAAAAWVKEAMNKLSAVFGEEEKEWKCHCGHVFRAAGEWVPTEPCNCEAPGCPNPRYFLDGPGRAMLEARNSGGSVEGGSSAAGSIGSSTSSAGALPASSGLGGRFGGGKK
jgi:hypothetical protein